jgi:hypothetical protein
MPDTARTFAEIIALLPDQTTQDISPQDLRDAMQSIATPIVGGGFDNTLGKPIGLSNVTASTRYVGGRASVPPAAGTFQLGDFVILQNGGMAVCTVAGTPGTWATINASGSIGIKSLAQYVIYRSGTTFYAHNNDTGADDYSGGDAAAVVQSAHDSAPAASLIELQSGVTYLASTQVILSKGGTMVRSRQQNGEDQSTIWFVNAALAAGNAAFRVTGAGAAVGGISVECNSNCDYGIDMRAGGGLLFESNCKEADVANFYMDGPNGAARCMFWGLRADNPTNQPVRTVTGVTAQGSGVYRFATSVAHGYLSGQVVMLKGFVTTGGKFQNPTTVLPATITNVSDTTHFDVDMDVAQTFTTSTGTAQRAATNIKLDGPDHIAWGLRTTGAATAGYALWMDTSRCQIASGHITGNDDEAGCVFISGAENRLSDFYLDTGPDGDNGLAHLTIEGSGNWVSALVQNASTDIGSATAKNVTGTSFVSGTTYRFTSTAHGFAAGDGVFLEGFASSSGYFSGGVTSGGFPIAAITTNTFDIDLGVTTAFTDSVGTAKPTTVITGTAFVSGTTYRFTTSAPHPYAPGHAVWLQGFASSNGAFQNTANKNVLVTNTPTTTTFDADLGATTTFTDSKGTGKKITKFGLLFQKPTSTAYVQGNVCHISWQGKGANLNDGEFLFALGILDENGNDPSSFARFSANRVVGNAANTTRFSNLEATWGSITHADKIFVDVWHYQNDTTTPMLWRTKATGVTGSVSATTVTVQHGLAGLPTRVSVTPRGDPAGRVWVSGITATQFVINSSAAPAGITYGWVAEM